MRWRILAIQGKFLCKKADQDKGDEDRARDRYRRNQNVGGVCRECIHRAEAEHGHKAKCGIEDPGFTLCQRFPRRLGQKVRFSGSKADRHAQKQREHWRKRSKKG